MVYRHLKTDVWKYSFDNEVQKYIVSQKTHSQKRLPDLLIDIAVICTGVFVSSLFAFCAWQELPPITNLDHFIQDAFVRFEGEKRPVQQLAVMADIDEQSLAAVGQWPWPRYRLAALINAIADHNPSAIGLDIIFPEPDRTSLDTIQASFQKEFGLDIQFQGVPAGLEDNDAYLGHVLKRTPSVGAIFMYFDLYNTGVECSPIPLEVKGQKEAISPPKASGILCNISKIQKNLHRNGFINTRLDDDGLLRRMQLIISYNGEWYPNLTLATIMQALNQNSIQIDSDIFGPIIRIGPLHIPVDETGLATIAYARYDVSDKRISALNILNNTVDPKTIENKVVFVGASAAGLNDLHNTPVGPEFPGAVAHVTLTENALSGTMYRAPIWKADYAALTTLLAGIIVTLLFAYSGPGWAASVTFILCILFPATSIIVFINQGVLLPVGAQLIALLFLLMLLSLLLYSHQRHLAYIHLKQFSRARQNTLEAMAAVAETRDPETGGHIKRTQHYVKALAIELAKERKRPELTPNFIELLFHSAPLHDVGKVGVPDHILLKPGKLTPDEFEEMKKHAVYGKEIVENASFGQEEKEFFNIAAEIAYTHHEKWDGSGYPRGLSSEDIPLSGRLMALADVYDALISKRHYKPAFSHEKSKGIIVEGRGKHFDPQIVDCFLAIEQEFIRIAATFKDEAEDTENENMPAAENNHYPQPPRSAT